MARKIKDKSIELDIQKDNSLSANDLLYVETTTVKDKLDTGTLPVVNSTDDAKILESYAVIPEEFGDEFDGDQSVSGIINEYTHLVLDAGLGSSVITVDTVTSEMVVGREIMLHQTQCSRDRESLFKYEFVRIASIDGNNITLEAGLRNSYLSDSGIPVDGKEDNTVTQVVTVPNYNILTLTADLDCKGWDGRSGGILAFRAKSLVGSNNIKANSRGFRGGWRRTPTWHGDWLIFAESGLGAYGVDTSPEVPLVHEPLRSEILIRSGNNINISWAAGSNLTKGGTNGSSLSPSVNEMASADVFEYNGVDHTVDDYNEILPFATGSVRVDTNSGDNYWNGIHNPSGGVIRCFVEDHSGFTGAFSAVGSGGSISAGAGGTIFVQTPTDPGYGGTISISGGTSTGSLWNATGGSGGGKTGEGENPASLGYRKTRKINSSHTPGDNSSLLTQEAIEALLASSTSPIGKLGEWSSANGDYTADESLVSYSGKIWLCLLTNDFNDPKEPGVDLGYWKDITASVVINGVDSSIAVLGSNGYGSTYTAIRRFTTLLQQIGSDVTYNDSATDGATLTIEKDGLYAIDMVDAIDTANHIGVTRNADPTVDITSVPAVDRLIHLQTGSTAMESGSTVAKLYIGDVIRMHSRSVNGEGTGSDQVLLRITRIGDLESQGNFTRNTAVLSAHRTTDHSVSTSPTDIIFDVVDYDNLTSYNNSTGEWTAPKNMTIRVFARVRSNVTANVFLNVEVDDTIIASSVKYSMPAYSSIEVIKTLEVSQGQVVKISCESSVSQTFLGSSIYTCLEIDQELAGDVDITLIPEIANADYYISPTGSDTTGDGSSGSPWATIQKAITHLAGYRIDPEVGCTINLNSGTYNFTAPQLIYHPDGDFLSIIGAGKATTIITNTTTNVLEIRGGNHVREISGFTIDRGTYGGTSSGIYLYRGANVYTSNVDIENMYIGISMYEGSQMVHSGSIVAFNTGVYVQGSTTYCKLTPDMDATGGGGFRGIDVDKGIVETVGGSIANCATAIYSRNDGKVLKTGTLTLTTNTLDYNPALSTPETITYGNGFGRILDI